MTGVILKNFEEPDETRVFEKGKFEIARIGGLTIGRATYQPGWKWSVHVARRSEPLRARKPWFFFAPLRAFAHLREKAGSRKEAKAES